MKKILFLAALTCAVSFTFTACGSDKKPEPTPDSMAPKKNDSTATVSAYVCPMGETCGTGDKPGKCPNCGMELQKRK